MIAVVSPHLDDAVLSAWLVLIRAQGATVVTCFAGIPDEGPPGSWDARAGFRSATEAVLARRREDDQVMASTGAVPVHLNLLDAQYRGDKGAPSVTEVAGALGAHIADADEVWLPAGIGGHPDHLLARRAALAALRDGQRARVYADLPYAGQPGWPPCLTGRLRDQLVDLAYARRQTRPSRVWSDAMEGLALGPVEALHLTGTQRRAKLAAVSGYASQLAALRCGGGHPLRSRRLFAREVSWELSAREPSTYGLSQNG